MNKHTRLYVDPEFKKKLQKMAIDNDCPVVELTKNIEIDNIRIDRRKKKNAFKVFY